MKVLVFTALYPNNVWPNQGVFIKERMTRFAGIDGCEVKVVAPVPYCPPFKFNWRWRYSQVARHEVRDGVDVYHPRYFMTPKVGMVLYGALMFISVLPAVKKLRKSFAFDLIDAHFVYPDGFAAVLLGKFFNKPVVVSARGSDVNLYSAFSVVRRLLQFALRRASRVIAVSQSLKQAILDLGIPEGSIEVIPNGVDAQKFYPIPRIDARKKLGLPDARILLSVASLTANKGLDLLIEAFGRVLRDSSDKNYFLVIVGEGAMRREIDALVSSLDLRDHVRLLGAVSHADLNLWYNAADLFCLLSENEGWPNVVLESLACGTPVLATKVGGIPEIIVSEAYGRLTDREVSKVEEAICASLIKCWKRDAILAYARKHTWENAAQSVRNVFQSVLDAEGAV